MNPSKSIFVTVPESWTEGKKNKICRNLQRVAYHPSWTDKCAVIKQELDKALERSYEALVDSKTKVGIVWDEGTYHVQTYKPREWLFECLLSGYTDDFRNSYIDGTLWGEEIVEVIHEELSEMCDALGIVLQF